MAYLKTWLGLGLMAIAIMSLSTPPGWADDQAKATALVDKARLSFNDLAADPNLTWLRNNLKTAKGILLVPEQFKAGFIFGGSGGSGVLLARDGNGAWSQPAFYGMGAGSVGFQIGAQVAEVALLIMTKKGVDALLSANVKLGGDISVAAGPVGAGAQVATADILAFARTKGLFGGVSVEGSVIGPRHALNRAYYGREASPVDILIRRDVKNEHATELVAAVTKMSQASP